MAVVVASVVVKVVVTFSCQRCLLADPGNFYLGCAFVWGYFLFAPSFPRPFLSLIFLELTVL